MQGVLKTFDIPTGLYEDDIKDIVATTVDRYGEKEWKIIVMTGEIHGHLGIYSTLGAKMGLRALDLFAARGVNGEVSVLSFCGSVPPVSCFNDGLQISTGATVGHGLITVSDDLHKRAEAIFRCNGQCLHLRLLPEYESIVRNDINKGVTEFGHTPSYWQYIRSLAIRYWRDWDRSVIFEEI